MHQMHQIQDKTRWIWQMNCPCALHRFCRLDDVQEVGRYLSNERRDYMGVVVVVVMVVVVAEQSRR